MYIVIKNCEIHSYGLRIRSRQYVILSSYSDCNLLPRFTAHNPFFWNAQSKTRERIAILENMLCKHIGNELLIRGNELHNYSCFFRNRKSIRFFRVFVSITFFSFFVCSCFYAILLALRILQVRIILGYYRLSSNIYPQKSLPEK